jgi:hypothetical protein
MTIVLNTVVKYTLSNILFNDDLDFIFKGVSSIQRHGTREVQFIQEIHCMNSPKFMKTEWALMPFDQFPMSKNLTSVFQRL